MLRKQFTSCHEYHNGLHCQRRDALISLVGWQHSVGTHPFKHSWEPAIMFNYVNLQTDSKLCWNHLTNSEFKITFSRFSVHFTVNFQDYRLYSCDSKGIFFFLQDMVDSSHLPDDSCDTLGAFCSWLLSVNLAWWFQASYVALLGWQQKMANNPCSWLSAGFIDMTKLLTWRNRFANSAVRIYLVSH